MSKRFIHAIVFCLFLSVSFFRTKCEAKTDSLYTKEIGDALFKNNFKEARTWIAKRGIIKDSIGFRPFRDTTLDYRYRNYNYYSSLVLLEANGLEDVIRYMMSNGTERESTYFKYLALGFACGDKNFPLIKLLLENGASVNFGYNSNESYDESPLKRLLIPQLTEEGIVVCPTTEMMEYLLKKGGILDAYYVILYSYADCKYDDVQYLKLMLKYGAVLTDSTKKNWASVLQIAAKWGSKEMLHYLIEEAKMDLEYKDENGWTALHYAAEIGNETAIKILLNAGAKKDAKTEKELCVEYSPMLQDEPKDNECYRAGSRPIDILQLAYTNCKDENNKAISSKAYENCLNILK